MKWLRRLRGSNASGTSGWPGQRPAVSDSGSSGFRFVFLCALLASCVSDTFAMDAVDLQPDLDSFGCLSASGDATIQSAIHSRGDDIRTHASPATPPECEAPASAPTVHHHDSDSDSSSAETVRQVPVSTPAAQTLQDVPAPDDIRRKQAMSTPVQQPTLVLRNVTQNLVYTHEVPFRLIWHDDTTSCTCSVGAPDEYCEAYFMILYLDAVCTALNLHPDYDLTNDTLDRPFDLVYPWFSEDDHGAGYDADQFETRETHNSHGDVMSWIRHASVQVKIPIHRYGPFEFNCSGTSIDDVPTNKPPSPAFDALDQESPVHAMHTDDDLPQPTPASGTDVDEESDDACVVDNDTYENDNHNEVFGYLRFRVFPMSMRMRGPEWNRKRKMWGQNARRRYDVRVHAATGIFRYSPCCVYVLLLCPTMHAHSPGCVCTLQVVSCSQWQRHKQAPKIKAGHQKRRPWQVVR